MQDKPSDHSMRLEPREMRHRQTGGCRLVRDEDTGAVSLFQCPVHEHAPEVHEIAKKRQHYLDVISGMSTRIKEETGTLAKRAEKLLGRVA